MIGKLWTDLSDEKKRQYQEKAEKSRTAYKAEMVKYNATQDKPKKRKSEDASSSRRKKKRSKEAVTEEKEKVKEKEKVVKKRGPKAK